MKLYPDGRGGISIHASRGGSDLSQMDGVPVWVDFNPRFPWGKRRRDTNAPHLARFISIHASRGGSDRVPNRPDVFWHGISIHASRGGSDRPGGAVHGEQNYFNPRFPWGKRRADPGIAINQLLFQSTLPVGEAT